MKNFVMSGEVLTLTAPSGGVVGGTPVLIGNMVVIPAADAAEGALFAGSAEGVFTCDKATSETWAEGDPLYWDNSGKKFTKTGTGNTPAGFAAAVAQSADTSGTVTIDPVGIKKAVTVAAIATADGSDAATTQALANATKTSVNAILAALKGAGLMA